MLKAQATVLFLFGDRISAAAAECTPRVAGLQKPAEVADILRAKFPGTAVLVTAPPRYSGDAACYDNLLPGPLDSQGVPAAFAAAGYPAAHGLAALLADAGLPAHGRGTAPLSLLGFSKAGVVLHQVLVELAAWQEAVGTRCAVCAWEQQAQQELPWQTGLASIRHLHFLDAGANSCGAAHPADPVAVLGPLRRRCAAHAVHLHLHGTPRQWRDPQRSWLGGEKDALAAAARVAGPGVVCSEREYFLGQPRSLEMHFAVLEAFDPQA